MVWWLRVGLALVVFAAGASAADAPRRISYSAEQVPGQEVLEALSLKLNRRLYTGWSEDPWLKKPLSITLADVCQRDALAELARVGERSFQRGDRWSFWLQTRPTSEQHLDERTVGDWLVRLRSVSYSYRAELQPGSGEPAKVEQALVVEWLLLPPDDLAMLALVDAEPHVLRYSDGTQVPVAEQRLSLSINEGYAMLTLRLPRPPAGVRLRLAELGLTLVSVPLVEKVLTLDLPAEGVTAQPEPIEGSQYTLERRGTRLIISARPAGPPPEPKRAETRTDPPPSAIARQLVELESSKQRAAEGRLLTADGQAILSATSCEPTSATRNVGAGLRIVVWPQGQEKPPAAAKVRLHQVSRGPVASRAKLVWRDLPLPPRTMGDLP